MIDPVESVFQQEQAFLAHCEQEPELLDKLAEYRVNLRRAEQQCQVKAQLRLRDLIELAAERLVVLKRRAAVAAPVLAVRSAVTEPPQPAPAAPHTQVTPPVMNGSQEQSCLQASRPSLSSPLHPDRPKAATTRILTGIRTHPAPSKPAPIRTTSPSLSTVPPRQSTPRSMQVSPQPSTPLSRPVQTPPKPAQPPPRPHPPLKPVSAFPPIPPAKASATPPKATAQPLAPPKPAVAPSLPAKPSQPRSVVAPLLPAEPQQKPAIPPSLPAEAPQYTGADLLHYREAATLTQRQLAAALGIAHGTVAKAEMEPRRPLTPLLQAGLVRLKHGSKS